MAGEAAATKDPVAETGELRAALAQAEENLKQQRDQYLRAAAELDNVRKRAQRDIERRIATRSSALPPSCCRCATAWNWACAMAATGDAARLMAGQEATLKLLDRAFERLPCGRSRPRSAL